MEGLCLSWSTRVLSVVGKLACVACRGNGIGVDDGSTTTSNQCPHTSSCIEDCELERSTSLCVHLCNVCLLLAHLTTERSWELEWWASVDGDLGASRCSHWHAQSCWSSGNSPLHTTFELSSLVDLGGKIEEVHLSGGTLCVWNDDERVDFEVGELTVDVDSV